MNLNDYSAQNKMTVFSHLIKCFHSDNNVGTEMVFCDWFLNQEWELNSPRAEGDEEDIRASLKILKPFKIGALLLEVCREN